MLDMLMISLLALSVPKADAEKVKTRNWSIYQIRIKPRTI